MANENVQRFHVVDVIILILVVLLSLFVGLYSVFTKKDRSVEEYILGKRSLKLLPVTFSLVASSISAYTIIAGPAEIYFHGLEYIYSFFAVVIPFSIFHFNFLPVFYNLKIITLYEYLEKRFNNSVRLLCSTFYVLQVIFYVPVMLLLSSLALNQVCGINFSIIVIISGVVTTIYTTLGGIRAVVWTDVVQTVFMMVGVIVLAIKGTVDVGSISTVWRRNYDGKRIDSPVFDFNLAEHYGVWSSLLGLQLTHFIHFYLNQGTVQRIVSVPSLSIARRTSLIFYIGTIAFAFLSSYNGLLAFAKYYNCDPFMSQKIMTKDQLMPIFTLDTFEHLPGMTGLFLAAIVSATLSSVSTSLNSVAAVVLQDYYKPLKKMNVTENQGSRVIKLTALTIGIVTTCFVFIVKQLESTVQVALSLLGTVSGSISGIFIIGIFLPWIKSKPTLIGSLMGFTVASSLCIISQVALFSGNLVIEEKPLSVDECSYNFTSRNITARNSGDVPGIFKIAPSWYSTFGFLTTILVACSLSLVMDRNSVEKMDKNLFCPLVQHMIERNNKKKLPQQTELVPLNMS